MQKNVLIFVENPHHYTCSSIVKRKGDNLLTSLLSYSDQTFENKMMKMTTVKVKMMNFVMFLSMKEERERD